MTTLTSPLLVKGGDTNRPSSAFRAGAVVVVPTRVTFGQFAGASASVTTLPLFVAPAGMRPLEAWVDVITPIAPVSGNTVRVGTAAYAGLITPETTITAVARYRSDVSTSANLSAISYPFTADTTIQFQVSTSGIATRTAGEIMVYVQLAADTSVAA